MRRLVLVLVCVLVMTYAAEITPGKESTRVMDAQAKYRRLTRVPDNEPKEYPAQHPKRDILFYPGFRDLQRPARSDRIIAATTVSDNDRLARELSKRRIWNHLSVSELTAALVKAVNKKHGRGFQGHIESARLLIEKGANVNYATPIRIKDVVLAAPKEDRFTIDGLKSDTSITHGSVDEFEPRYQSMPKISHHMTGGKTLLMMAAEQQDPDMMALLLENGARMDATDTKGRDVWQWLDSTEPTPRYNECTQVLVDYTTNS